MSPCFWGYPLSTFFPRQIKQRVRIGMHTWRLYSLNRCTDRAHKCYIFCCPFSHLFKCNPQRITLVIPHVPYCMQLWDYCFKLSMRPFSIHRKYCLVMLATHRIQKELHTHNPQNINPHIACICIMVWYMYMGIGILFS